MIRMLGFLAGAAITIGGMLLMIGLPELRATLPDRPQPPVTVAPAPAPAPPTEHVATVAAVQPAELPGINTLEEPAPPAETVPAAAESMPDPVAASDEPHWHSFWNPFRSEIAANGFAARLRSVTGIDYRVVRLKPGSYQVAFAYGDESERRTKIAQIETATGLDLPEESR